LKYLLKHELKKLPDHRLLTLYRSTYKRMKSAYAFITDYGSYPEILNDKNNDEVVNCVRLNDYCDQIKLVLNTRGNIK